MITKRNDGTYVIDLNGHPYHVTPDDPLFAGCEQTAETLSEVYCYYADGMSRKIVNSDYVAGDGEVVFMTEPTGTELAAAFVGYTDARSAEIQSQLTAAVQSHLDAAARAARYDDIKTACTYADEPSVAKFQAEGVAFRAWRSLVWAACYAIMDEVLAGTRSIPTMDELIAELPKLGAEV